MLFPWARRRARCCGMWSESTQRVRVRRDGGASKAISERLSHLVNVALLPAGQQCAGCEGVSVKVPGVAIRTRFGQLFLHMFPLFACIACACVCLSAEWAKRPPKESSFPVPLTFGRLSPIVFPFLFFPPISSTSEPKRKHDSPVSFSRAQLRRPSMPARLSRATTLATSTCPTTRVGRHPVLFTPECHHFLVFRRQVGVHSVLPSGLYLCVPDGAHCLQ